MVNFAANRAYLSSYGINFNVSWAPITSSPQIVNTRRLAVESKVKKWELPTSKVPNVITKSSEDSGSAVTSQSLRQVLFTLIRYRFLSKFVV